MATAGPGLLATTIHLYSYPCEREAWAAELAKALKNLNSREDAANESKELSKLPEGLNT